jgi:hypothetical protein
MWHTSEDQRGCLGTEGMIILKWILKMQNGSVRTGIIRFRIEATDWLSST